MVDTLQNLVNELRVDFDAIRDDVTAKLNQCSDHIKSAEKLCGEATSMHSDLESKLTNAMNVEKEWKEIQVKLVTTSLKGKVLLDVGGTKYATTIDTLTREKNTFFTALFSTQWELERDPDDKSIFIDRDGDLFQHILAYLRTNREPVGILNQESLRQLLIVEAEYYQLHGLFHKLTGPERKEKQRIDALFPEGTLLRTEHKTKLNEFYGAKDRSWRMIYKASRDGFDSNSFHSKCDNQESTMTVIQSEHGYLFGGFTSNPWKAHLSHDEAKQGFLFTLTNPHNIPPTKYEVKASSGPIYVNAAPKIVVGGPTFGTGPDIQLLSNSNVDGSSSIAFPTTFIDTTGKGASTFTGGANFTTSDIEVYKVPQLRF